jgi:hypothetical protein
MLMGMPRRFARAPANSQMTRIGAEDDHVLWISTLPAIRPDRNHELPKYPILLFDSGSSIDHWDGCAL